MGSCPLRLLEPIDSGFVSGLNHICWLHKVCALLCVHTILNVLFKDIGLQTKTKKYYLKTGIQYAIKTPGVCGKR